MGKIIKIAVLGSGNGSNFEAIVKYFEGRSNIDITCFSDKEDSQMLERAENLGVKSSYLPFEKTYDYFSQNSFDLFVLAGYMRVLPEEVLRLGIFVNIHPSLLPAFKGLNAIKQAYDFGVKITGVTIHYAEKNVDEGKIIAQSPVAIGSDMNLAELEEKIHEAEHKLYPMVVESLLYDKVVDYQINKGGCNSCGS